MDYVQIQAYAGFWTGTVFMISVHNMFLSIFLYRARQTNISNMIKVIFNFGNILRFGGVFGLYMTPKAATLVQCTSLQYLCAVGNAVTRVSLIAFLLWRLKQVHNSKVDNWIAITLFVFRTGVGFVVLGIQRPSTLYLPDEDVVICLTREANSRYFILSCMLVEFVVDIFVTLRLIQVLRKANRNAASISSNMTRKSRRTLFTAVMYWNFLRLFVAVIFHLIPLLNLFVESEILASTMTPIINIILSYVITVDAEIVRVIEGKDAKKGGSAGTEKSLSSPRTPRAPPHYSGYSPSDLPKYSPQSFDETHSQLDEDRIVVVSMKRLSFFEWANVVVGKRLRKNNSDRNEEQYEDENTVEIIDGTSEAVEEDLEEDLEEGFSQDRKSSNFSGTTSVTETDENMDIVIR